MTTRIELKKAEARGFARGVAVACGIIQSSHDEPVVLSEVLMATDFDTRAKLKAAGAEDYDLKLLRPVFAECKMRRS